MTCFETVSHYFKIFESLKLLADNPIIFWDGNADISEQKRLETFFLINACKSQEPWGSLWQTCDLCVESNVFII